VLLNKEADRSQTAVHLKSKQNKTNPCNCPLKTGMTTNWTLLTKLLQHK